LGVIDEADRGRSVKDSPRSTASFAIDVLACPECGGWLRFIATINDFSVL
jgi:hypothetical protein